jgi:endoglucanase
MLELFETLQTLNAAHGPSGDESGVRAVIETLAKPFADDITTDTMGNLIAHKKGSGPKVMLAAHMDSIGFIVTHMEDTGFLRVGALGGISPKEAVYTPVRFRNGVRGVFVPEEKTDFAKLKLDACYVDIGAKDKEDAQKLVQVGDTAVYDTPTFQNGCKVISPYLDNRISCAILLSVLSRLPQQVENDLFFVFTVQEEVGLRGAKTAAWAVNPDWALAIDVTDVDDTPGTERYGTVQLGKGAAIKRMDSSIICHPAVVDKLEQLARDEKISAQKDIMRAGGTDAGAIHVTRSGVPTGGISVPCRYVHTPVETADLTDAQACADLALSYVTADLTSNLH